MVESQNRTSCRSTRDERHMQPSLLILETPDVEEIAKAIWQRQHDAVAHDTIAHNTKWRDKSIPALFWEEFLRDAQAVLSLLTRMHAERQRARLDVQNLGTSPSMVALGQDNELGQDHNSHSSEFEIG